jgi:hypothetical protein
MGRKKKQITTDLIGKKLLLIKSIPDGMNNDNVFLKSPQEGEVTEKIGDYYKLTFGPKSFKLKEEHIRKESWVKLLD